MPALPYNKKRRYLSGIDWTIGAINAYMESTGGAGNHSSLVFELAGRLSEVLLRERLEYLHGAIPLLSGRRKRDFANLAPYWEPGTIVSRSFSIDILDAESASEIAEILKKRLNRPFAEPDEHLAFLLLRGKNSDVLVMTFDHMVLDARGAELFSRLLSGADDSTARGAIGVIKTTDSPGLRNWAAKFDAGRFTQRKIIAMTKNGGCAAISDARVGQLNATPRLSFHSYAFSSDTTRKIEADAERAAGYMMETVYLLAATALSLRDSMSLLDGKESEWLFVPVPIDLRNRSSAPFKLLLFNHFSFLFYHFEISAKTTLESLCRELRNQTMELISNEFPEKMGAATRLGRIFPFPLIRRFMRIPFEGKMASFVFANVGDGAPTNDILGVEVESIRHMPRIPTPPGLGVFFGRSGGRLNLSITCDDANLPSELGEKLLREVVAKLTNT